MSFIAKFRFSILWAIILFVISVIPNNNLPKTSIPNIDILVHFCLYFILSCLMISGDKKEHAHISYSKLLAFIMISGGYGMILELIQPIVSDRASEFSDFLANFIGASFGAGLMFIYHKPK